MACASPTIGLLSWKYTVVKTENFEEAAMRPSKKTCVICKFLYYGNLLPKLEWLTILNSWSVTCSESNDTINCTFEKACTEVNKPLFNAVPSATIGFLTWKYRPTCTSYSGENCEEAAVHPSKKKLIICRFPYYDNLEA